MDRIFQQSNQLRGDFFNKFRILMTCGAENLKGNGIFIIMTSFELQHLKKKYILNFIWPNDHTCVLSTTVITVIC